MALFAAAAPAAAGARGGYDYDGDGRADYAVYHRALGAWHVLHASGGTLSTSWGWPAAVPVNGDFDGDGRTDFAVFDRSTGSWAIQRSDGFGSIVQGWGWSETAPVPGDYDGDGRTDIAVYHQLSGTWFVLYSSGGSLTQQWGWSETRPVPADYDGDGRTDIAVYFPGNGAWYILFSRGGSQVLTWGWSEAMPVPGDYDGDGRADLAVYNAQSGNWLIRKSAGGTRVQGWGWSAAGAVPADYDGDGRTDIAVYFPDGGAWYILPSSGGSYAQSWGWSEARAVGGYAHGAREGIKVLAFGDSITYGSGSGSQGPATGYPVLLDRVLEGFFGGNLVSINEGVLGETTTPGRMRIDAVLDAYRPEVLLLMEGTNDCQMNRPPAEIQFNLESMVSAATARGIRVVLATLPPVISTPQYDRAAQMNRIIAFNPTIQQIGLNYGVYVANVFQAMTSVPNWQNTLMDRNTGNHPNDAGYRVVRDAFRAAVFDALRRGLVY